MYRAKGSGKAYCFYRIEMGAELSRRLELAMHLARAVEERRLALAYQPQVALADGRLIGAEALCRWHDPLLGTVSPAEFIPIAEERGLILTESGMVHHPERAVEVMNALTRVGFSLAIDDFGTGYSSLAYLRRLPVRKLKIDLSFVRDMLVDRNDHTIVQTIVAMGRSLELTTLAEGVEMPEQAAALRALGCYAAQGFLYGRPLAADAFAERWITGRGRQDQGLAGR